MPSGLQNICLAVLLLIASAAAAAPADEYASLCASCHQPGIHGAPKVGDRVDWIRRLRPGLNMVYRNALEGIPNTAMLPKGGQAGLSHAATRAIVDYMIAASAVPVAALQAAARYDRLNISDRDFIRRDANYDGVLSRNELAGDALLLRNLARFDANGDGRLGETEYRNAEAVLARELAAVEVDDGTLDAAVRSALSAIKGLDMKNLKTEVRSGTVTVTGIVEHPHVALQAQDALKRIAGIRKIDNRLVAGEQLAWD